jgi:hypothetical protein
MPPHWFLRSHCAVCTGEPVTSVIELARSEAYVRPLCGADLRDLAEGARADSDPRAGAIRAARAAVGLSPIRREHRACAQAASLDGAERANAG